MTPFPFSMRTLPLSARSALLLSILAMSASALGAAAQEPERSTEAPRPSGAMSSEEIRKLVERMRTSTEPWQRPASKTMSIVEETPTELLPSPGATGDSVRPNAPTWEQFQAYLNSNHDVRDAWKGSLICELGLRAEAAKKRQREIDRTNQIGLAIFGVVHMMLVLAMVAAGLEFASARRIRRTRSGEQTQIEVGLEGVALRTSLQGLLLLTVALGFYFLYLRFVYPIVEV